MGEFTTTGRPACLGEVGPLSIGWWNNGRLTYIKDEVSYGPDEAEFPEQVILLGKMTSPELFSVIKRIAGIATEQGGITCHAAIVAREMKIPTIVGCGQGSLFEKWGSDREVSIKSVVGGGTLTWHEVGKK